MKTIVCFSPSDLCGEWIGYYPGHFEQVIRIEVVGDYIVASKVTGDDYVPAGEITWRVNIHTGCTEGQIAEREFVNPRFVPGKLFFHSREHIIFSWEKCSSVEYRRDE